MVMELDPRQECILATIDRATQEIWSVSHQIHAHPELGYQETFASQLLKDTLHTFGFEIEVNFAGIQTAFCARKNSGSGPRVAFLAEYDALPEIGHACGHNLIATTALTAGIGLGSVVAETGGEVWVVGTPAEETDGAKVHLVNRGGFKGVDAALMVHPHMGNYYLTESLAMDAIQLEFFGKPSHAAAAPWEGINALDAVILTFNNVNALRQQIRPDARIHGIITQGGTAPNIIPDHTVARFYIRAPQRSYLNSLVEKFKACAQAAAAATGAQLEVSNYESSFDDMLNNVTLAERMRERMEALGSPPFKRAPDHYGSVDMGNVSHAVPGIHILFDIANGEPMSPHTREFCAAARRPYADEALIRAGKALALTGYDVLTDAGFLASIKKEFEEAASE